jgi:hypothetical protein
MDLLERYLQAVGFWLPKRQKEDILAELSEDLRSQIDEKEVELGRRLTEDELGTILKQCGPPGLVANRYQPQRYLIGPAVFPIYWLVLRTALLWALAPWLLVSVVLAIYPGASLLGTLQAIWWAGACLTAGITLGFAVVERVQARTRFLERWNPSKLPPVVKPPKPVGRADSIVGLVFCAVFLAWWLTVPHDWRLVFGPGAGMFQVSPALHGYYVPVILTTVATMAQAIINLFRPQWTWLPPATRFVTTAVGLGIVKSMVSAYPYIILSDAASHQARYENTALIINQSLLWSAVITEVVIFILLIVYAIQCVQVVRRWMEGDRDPAALHV